MRGVIEIWKNGMKWKQGEKGGGIDETSSRCGRRKAGYVWSKQPIAKLKCGAGLANEKLENC